MSAWVATAVVVTGHFAAAFTALGIPPYFPLIVQRSFHTDIDYLAGWAYVLPAVVTALSAPAWGRLADRFGKKPLLIRAHLGLAFSFLLAGYAWNVWVFLAALALQGLLGGAFSAANAYLATRMTGAALSRALTLTQGSARAALAFAPAVLGWLLTAAAVGGSPVTLYRYLALAPLAAAAAALFLPADQPAARTKRPPAAAPHRRDLHRLYGIQFAFSFGTVVTFPYFIPLVQERLGADGAVWAGMLFGLPHLAYLAGAGPLHRLSGGTPAADRLSRGLALALGLMAGSITVQALTGNAVLFTAARLAMGLAMTAGFVALHAAIARAMPAETAGSAFGRLESAAKWGGVAAGLAAGLVAHALGNTAALYAGAVMLAATALFIAGAGIAPRQAASTAAEPSLSEPPPSEPTPSDPPPSKPTAEFVA